MVMNTSYIQLELISDSIFPIFLKVANVLLVICCRYNERASNTNLCQKITHSLIVMMLNIWHFICQMSEIEATARCDPMKMIKSVLFRL